MVRVFKQNSTVAGTESKQYQQMPEYNQNSQVVVHHHSKQFTANNLGNKHKECCMCLGLIRTMCCCDASRHRYDMFVRCRKCCSCRDRGFGDDWQ